MRHTACGGDVTDVPLTLQADAATIFDLRSQLIRQQVEILELEREQATAHLEWISREEDLEAQVARLRARLAAEHTPAGGEGAPAAGGEGAPAAGGEGTLPGGEGALPGGERSLPGGERSPPGDGSLPRADYSRLCRTLPSVGHKLPPEGHTSLPRGHRSPLGGCRSPLEGSRLPVGGHTSLPDGHRLPPGSYTLLNYTSTSGGQRSPLGGHRSPLDGHRSPIEGHRSPLGNNPSRLAASVDHRTPVSSRQVRSRVCVSVFVTNLQEWERPWRGEGGRVVEHGKRDSTGTKIGKIFAACISVRFHS